MLLNNRYEVHEQIGRDSKVVVYRGRDLRMDSVVAVKVLGETWSRDPKFVTSFHREAKRAMSLKHPNIVGVFDFGQSDDKYYAVCELIEGTDLQHYLAHIGGIIDVNKVVMVAHAVARGVGYLHEGGLVHGSLNSTKVLIGRNGVVKIDPIRIDPIERVPTPATDVYLVGSIMSEMLYGEREVVEFRAQPQRSIPGALEEIIMRCLDKQYNNGNELAVALSKLVQ